MSEGTTQEIWNVRLGPGQVRAMTLDEIDAAFDQGLLTASTMVLPPGAIAWVTLGAAAGLDEEASCASATPAPVTTESLAGPSSLAPVAIQNAPASLESLVPPPPALDDVDFEAAHRRSRIKLILGGVGVIALIAGLGVVGARIANQTEASVLKAAAGPPLRETKLSDLGDEGAPSTRVLTEEQKRRLEEADKARAAAAAKRREREQQQPRKPTKFDDPFKKSTGNKYDPLNGNL